MTDASTFFPGQLYQNPDGSFSLNITGHVHAAGLDLDASQSVTPPDNDRIRWINQPDGKITGSLAAYGESVNGGMLIDSIAPLPGTQSGPTLRAIDDLGIPQAELDLNQVNRSQGRAVLTFANQSVQILLLDYLLRSGFLQTGIGNILSSVLAVNLTWPGGSSLSNVVNVKLPGASGGVNAIVSPTALIPGTFNIPTVMATSDGAGGVNVRGQLPSGAAVAAASGPIVILLAWGT